MVIWIDAEKERRARRAIFPPIDAIKPSEDGLVALGADLAEETLLEAYRKGLFPWRGRPPITWYSPDPRLILLPEAFVAHRSLRKRWRTGGFEVSLDRAFPHVMRACALIERPEQEGTWIDRNIYEGYVRLHRRGVAHSVEVWRAGQLVGGLYGLAMGRAFFGESMFALAPDASKIALWRLTCALRAADYHFVDCQQDTPHLRSLGAQLVSRLDYQERLFDAVSEPEGWPEVRAHFAAATAE